MACSHIEASQRVYGEGKYNGSSSYYINPVGIESMVLSAKELGNHTAISMDSITAFSARVHLSSYDRAPAAISFPLVQGMPYFTAEYSGTTPLIQTGVFFRGVTKVTRDPKPNLSKFTFKLEDGSTWRLYAWRTRGEELDIYVANSGLAEARRPFTGILQISKDPMTPGSEAILDDGAGIYPVTLALSGSANGTEGRYRFDFRRHGHSMGNLYMYALPHHVDSFDNETTARVQRTHLQTPTKGMATLVRGNDWTMVVRDIPIDMGFSPWHPEKGSVRWLSDRSKSLIRAAAAKEASQNMIAQTNLDSAYFSGKVSYPSMNSVRRYLPI